MRLTIDFALRRLCIALLIALLPCWITVSNAQDPPDSESLSEYNALLTRVRQGDMTVDFRAFRIAAALSVGKHKGPMDFTDNQAWRQAIAAGDFQAALDVANRTLDRNYASLFGHYNALIACQKLSKTEEAGLHERLVKALTESIVKSGDGMSMQTAWFVATVPEEYFMLRVLGVRPVKQSLGHSNGHTYDILDAVDPQTQQSRSIWFNTHVDMGNFPVSQPGSSPNPPDQMFKLDGNSAPLQISATASVVARPTGGRGSFDLVEQPAGVWGVVWNIHGSYEITPTEIVVKVESGTATLHKGSLPAKPITLDYIRLGICGKPVGGSVSMYSATEVLLNHPVLDGSQTYSFSATEVRVPLPRKPLPEANWLCGNLWTQGADSKSGFYPARSLGKPLLPGSSQK